MNKNEFIYSSRDQTDMEEKDKILKDIEKYLILTGTFSDGEYLVLHLNTLSWKYSIKDLKMYLLYLRDEYYELFAEQFVHPFSMN